MNIKKRKLGQGPEITEVGLGTWAIGGAWRFGWGPQDAEVSRKTILKSLGSGINWIDTAPVYGLGLAEELLGSLPDSMKKNHYISTKCGITWNDQKKVSFDMSPASIRRECEASLGRLKTDTIDFYQIHWPDKKTLAEDAWTEMTRLKQEGKVRYIGLSNFDIKRIIRCHRIQPVDFLQVPYNMLRREIENEVLPWARKENVGILAYSPMQSGLLTGKFSKGYVENLPEGDWRKKDSFFSGEKFEKVLNLVEELKPLIKSPMELSSLAVAWVLSRPEVSAAIVGARNEEQAAKIINGSFWKLTEEEKKSISESLLRFGL